MNAGFLELKVEFGDPSRSKVSDVSALLKAACSIGKSTNLVFGFFFFSLSKFFTKEWRVSLLPFSLIRNYVGQKLNEFSSQHSLQVFVFRWQL